MRCRVRAVTARGSEIVVHGAAACCTHDALAETATARGDVQCQSETVPLLYSLCGGLSHPECLVVVSVCVVLLRAPNRLGCVAATCAPLRCWTGWRCGSRRCGGCAATVAPRRVACERCAVVQWRGTQPCTLTME